MKNKILTSIILLVVLVSILLIASCAKPPEDVEKAGIENSGTETTGNTVSDDMVDNSAMNDANPNDETVSEQTKKAIIMDESSFEFEGYAVGKSHIGTFDEISGDIYVDSLDNVVGMNLIINPATVNTGIDGLDKHLISDDFFDVEMYPEITVDLIEIVDGMAKVNLKFRGITREVSFSVTEDSGIIFSEFLLDTEAYKMKYIGVNKEVRIKFSFRY